MANPKRAIKAIHGLRKLFLNEYKPSPNRSDELNLAAKQYVLDLMAKAEAEFKRGKPGRHTRELLQMFETAQAKLKARQTNSERDSKTVATSTMSEGSSLDS